jgi:hypothetical protein
MPLKSQKQKSKIAKLTKNTHKGKTNMANSTYSNIVICRNNTKYNFGLLFFNKKHLTTNLKLMRFLVKLHKNTPCKLLTFTKKRL